MEGSVVFGLALAGFPFLFLNPEMIFDVGLRKSIFSVKRFLHLAFETLYSNLPGCFFLVGLSWTWHRWLTPEPGPFSLSALIAL